MALEDAPAYQWYVKDWRSSASTMRMSFAQRGVYREMLDQQWEDMSGSALVVANGVATTVRVGWMRHEWREAAVSRYMCKKCQHVWDVTFHPDSIAMG